MKIKIFVIVLLIGVTACSPLSSENNGQIMAKVEEATPYPTYTPFPTYTFQPTYTAYPSFTPFPTSSPTITFTPTPEFTPTNTVTPTETATPTLTPTPFNVSGCVSFSFPAGLDADYEGIRAQLEGYVGKCVRFFFERTEFLGSYTDYLKGDDLVYSVEVKVVKDDFTPPETSKPKVYGRVWGILEAPKNRKDPYVLQLRKSEIFADNQLPIEEGRYLVGESAEISPGLWKSGASPTWTGECYWAIINPSTGNIKQNHFGIGGMTVRLSGGDLFETNEKCSDWYYIGP